MCHQKSDTFMPTPAVGEMLWESIKDRELAVCNKPTFETSPAVPIPTLGCQNGKLADYWSYMPVGMGFN